MLELEREFSYSVFLPCEDTTRSECHRRRLADATELGSLKDKSVLGQDRQFGKTSYSFVDLSNPDHTVAWYPLSFSKFNDVLLKWSLKMADL